MGRLQNGRLVTESIFDKDRNLLTPLKTRNDLSVDSWGSSWIIRYPTFITHLKVIGGRIRRIVGYTTILLCLLYRFAVLSLVVWRVSVSFWTFECHQKVIGGRLFRSGGPSTIKTAFGNLPPNQHFEKSHTIILQNLISIRFWRIIVYS